MAQPVNVLGTVKRPRPHPGQRIVFGSKARFNVASMGRRWRKTSGAMSYVAIPRALEGRRFIWAAPTHKQTQIGWDECYRAASEVARFNKTEQTAYFDKTGGRIMFFSMEEPDNARGHSADDILVDEAGDVPEFAWYEVLRPMLFDTKGTGWLQGTPKGRNWFWREWVSGADRADTAVWQAPAYGVRIDPESGELIRAPHPLENTDLDFQEICDIWAMTPERSFRQEYLAEFLDDGGGVFRSVDSAVKGVLREPYEGSFTIGCDFARVNDFTVLTVMDTKTKAVVDWKRFTQVDWPTQQLRLKALYGRWSSGGSKCTIIAESNMAGDVLIQNLQKEGLPIIGFNTNYKSKGALIEDLVLAIERGRLSYPDIPVLLGELKAYEQERLPSGVMRYTAPSGLHDDCVISLALAWRMAKNSNDLRSNQDFRFTVNHGQQKTSLLDQYRRSLWAQKKVLDAANA